MQARYKWLLRIIQICLLFQALLPFRMWQTTKPGMYGWWTRGHLVACTLLVLISLTQLFLVPWLQVSRSKLAAGFLGAKAAGLAMWLFWLFIMLRKSGRGAFFLLVGSAFYLLVWILADCVEFVLVNSLAKGTGKGRANTCRCDFCGVYNDVSSLRFLKSATGSGICEGCVQGLLLEEDNGPEALDKDLAGRLVERIYKQKPCGFCGRTEDSARILGGEYGGFICTDCVNTCHQTLRSRKGEEQAAALFTEAVKLLNLGDMENALEDLNQTLEANPGHWQAYASRGAIHHTNKDHTKALEDYNRALELEEHPGTLANRGSLLTELGEYNKALSDLNRSLELEPYQWQARNTRAALFCRQGAYEKALADYNRLLEQREEAPFRTARGGVHLFLKDYDKALADLDRALELGPDVNTYLYRGAVFYNQSSYQEAKTQYRKAVECDGKNTNALLMLGCTCCRLGQGEEGWEAFTKAIALEPDNGALYNGRGFFLAWAMKERQCRLEGYTLRDALADCQQAVEMSPQANHYDSRGYAHCLLGDYDQAFQDLNRALELEPEGWEPRLHLARCCLDTGREEEAHRHYLAMVALPCHEEYAARTPEAVRRVEGRLKELGYLR